MKILIQLIFFQFMFYLVPFEKYLSHKIPSQVNTISLENKNNSLQLFNNSLNNTNNPKKAILFNKDINDTTTNRQIKNQRPIANFNFPIVAAINENVVFNAESSQDFDDSFVSYDWTINNIKLKGKTIDYVFTKSGKFKIRLKVTNNSKSKNNTSEIIKEIKINEGPQAIFNIKKVYALGEKIILDGSKSFDKDGYIVNSEWQFEDGSILVGSKQFYTFNKTGNFKINLKVKDNDNVTNSTQSITKILRINKPPKANAGPDIVSNSGLINLSANLSVDSDDVLLDYDWDLGDGEKTKAKQLSHYYKHAQTYRVVLKVNDRSGVSNSVDFDTLTIRINQRPIIQTLDNIVTEANQIFKLDANASKDPDGYIKSFEWIFNNQKQIGLSSNFSIAKSGNYQVELNIMDNDGAFDKKYINIFVNSSPIAKFKKIFRIAPKEICILDASDSYDSDGKIINYRWSIEGQKNIFGKKIETKFDQSGRYLVTLFVKDNNNALNSISQFQQIIEVNYPPNSTSIKDIISDKHLVEFDLSSLQDPDGDKITFDWNFGDGEKGTGNLTQHFYSVRGVYPVSVTINDGQNLKNSSISLFFKTIINSKPLVKINAKTEAFAGETILFNALNSSDADNDLMIFKWDFDDGEFSGEMNPTHKFIKPGQYSVRLIVKDNSPLENQESFNTHFINILNAPVALAGEDQNVCSHTIVYFDGSKSTGGGKPIKTFEWDFGDGEKGGGINPTHVFKTEGLFNVKLTVSIEGTGQTSSFDELTVKVSSAPIALFNAKSEACINEPVNFDASKSSSYNSKIIEYIWEMGNGEKQTGKIINYSYPKEGTYTVTLHVKSADNNLCNSSFIKQFIRINNAPHAEIFASSNGAKINNKILTINRNEYVFFNAEKSYDPDGKIYTYTWLINNNKVSQDISFSYLFSEIKNNSVVLIVQDYSLTNCRNQKDSIYINVSPVEQLQIQTPLKAWVNDKLTFSSNLLDTKWQISDIYKEAKQNISYTFSKAGIYSITAISTYSQKSAIITILDFPKLILPDTIFIINGDSLMIKAEIEEQTYAQLNFEWNINNLVFKGQILNALAMQNGWQNIGLKYSYVSSFKDKIQSHIIPMLVYPKLEGEIKTENYVNRINVARNEMKISLISENEGIVVNWLINNEKFSGSEIIYEIKKNSVIKMECSFMYNKFNNNIKTIKKEIFIK